MFFFKHEASSLRSDKDLFDIKGGCSMPTKIKGEMKKKGCVEKECVVVSKCEFTGNVGESELTVRL